MMNENRLSLIHHSSFRIPHCFSEPRLVGRADSEVLAVFEAYVFAARGEDAAGADRAAQDSADGRALAAAEDGADDRSDARAGPDLRHVVFRPVAATDAALFVNLADAFARPVVLHLHDLR